MNVVLNFIEENGKKKVKKDDINGRFRCGRCAGGRLSPCCRSTRRPRGTHVDLLTFFGSTSIIACPVSSHMHSTMWLVSLPSFPKYTNQCICYLHTYAMGLSNNKREIWISYLLHKCLLFISRFARDKKNCKSLGSHMPFKKVSLSIGFSFFFS